MSNATGAGAAAAGTRQGQAAVTDAADATVDDLQDMLDAIVVDDAAEGGPGTGGTASVEAVTDDAGDDDANDDTNDEDPPEGDDDPADADAGTQVPPQTPTEEQADAAAAGAAGAGAGAQTQAKGPDVAQLQKDLAGAVGKLEQLQQKVDAGGTLTTAEQKQAQTQARKIDKIREALANPKKRSDGQPEEFDALEHGQALAEAQLEQDTTLQQLAGEVKELKGKLAAREQQDQQRANDQAWADHQRQYPGVDCKGVFKKCLDDAAALIGNDNPAILNLASSYFHQRAAAAAKGIAAAKKGGAGGAAAGAGGAAGSAANNPATATTQTRKTPGHTPAGARDKGAKTGVATSTPPLSPNQREEQEELEALKALVTDDA